eukprot:5553401-Amphidinium_carterae.2
MAVLKMWVLPEKLLTKFNHFFPCACMLQCIARHQGGAAIQLNDEQRHESSVPDMMWTTPKVPKDKRCTMDSRNQLNKRKTLYRVDSN